MPERPADEAADGQSPNDITGPSAAGDGPADQSAAGSTRPSRRRRQRPDAGPAPEPDAAATLVPVMADAQGTATGDTAGAAATADAAGAAEDPSDLGPDDVTADVVSISQGGVQVAHARHVDVAQGGIWRAEASDVAVSQGGIGIARGDRVSIEMGAAGIALAQDLRISQAYAREVIARDVEVDQGAIGTLITAQARFTRRGLVGILIAQKVDGDVRAILDWRGALALGAAVGAVLALLRRR